MFEDDAPAAPRRFYKPTVPLYQPPKELQEARRRASQRSMALARALDAVRPRWPTSRSADDWEL